MNLENLYSQYKPYLFKLAYKMTGSVNEAEDIVQDIFVSLSGRDIGEIGNIKAYLTKMAANRCINVLKSGRRKRETYVGPWLPEPFVEKGDQEPDFFVERKEHVSYAFLVMMERLTPTERVLFLLREVLGYDYGEIAEWLNKTETNCRKIVSRAKSKMKGIAGEDVHVPKKHERFAEAFSKAVNTGQFAPLVGMLSENAVLITDGGGKVRAALKPILGKERVLAFLKGVAAKGSFRGAYLPVDWEGETGLVLKTDGRAKMAVFFASDPDGSLIQTIYIIRNPEKLARL